MTDLRCMGYQENYPNYILDKKDLMRDNGLQGDQGHDNRPHRPHFP